MKKIIALTLSVLMLFAFCSCDNTKYIPDNELESRIENDDLPSYLMPDLPNPSSKTEGESEKEETSSQIKDLSTEDSKNPEDNPKPVDITANGAHIKTPISYTDSLTGESVDFSAQFYEIVTDKSNTDAVAVVSGAEQLKQAAEEFSLMENNHIESFSEAFFEEKLLVVIECYRKATDEFIIYDVVAENETLNVIIDCGETSSEAKSVCYLTFVEIRKNDIEDIKYLVVNMKE